VTGSSLPARPVNVERKLTPYPLRNWEIMPDPTPVMGENDCAVSLGLFGARKL
jgi:mediator of RNA polymerase II transcription subunit 12